MTHYVSIATALALSLLVVPACKKDKKEDKAETSEKKGDDSTAKGDKGSTDKGSDTKTGSAAMGDVISHFPADTEIVVALNMTSLTGSDIWKKYGDIAMKDAKDDLGEFKEACGFDPIASIKSIHLGINSSKDKEVVLIAKGIDRATVTKCVKAIAEKEGEKIEITEEGKFTFTVSDGEKTGMVWLDDTTVLLVPEKSDKEFLQARLDGKDSLKDNAAFAALAGKAKQSEPVWFAGALKDGSPAASGMGAMGEAPKGFYGSVGVSGGIDFNLGLTYADEKTATETLNMVKPMLGMAKGPLGPAADLLDKLKMATSGADLTVALKLTDADIDKLKDSAGSILGGM